MPPLTHGIGWILAIIAGLMASLISVNILASRDPSALPGPSWESYVNARNLPLLIAAALLAIWIIMLAAPAASMPTRVEGIGATIRGWQQSHRPLTYVGRNGRLYRGTFGDDPGLYLLAPIFSVLGLTSQRTDLILAIGGALAATGLVVASYLWLRRFPRHELTLGALLPALVATAYLFRLATDIYWVPAAVGGLGMLLLCADATWSAGASWKYNVAFLGFAVSSAMATLVRGTSSTIAIVTIVACGLLFEPRNRARQIVRVAALVIAVTLPGVIRNATTSYRDNYFAARGADAAPLLDVHVFWHSVYIGLGITTNKYHIAYADSSAFNQVARVEPSVAYQSAAYEDVLKRETLALFRNDTGFVLRQYLIKLLILLPSLVLLVPLYRFRTEVAAHDAARRVLLAGILVAAIGMLPGLLAVPSLRYAAGGVVALFLLPAVVLIVARLRPVS